MTSPSVRRAPGRFWLTAMRAFAVRPRLTAALASGLLLFAALPPAWRASTRALAAWDFAVLLFLVLVLLSMRGKDGTRIRQQAARQDEGRHFILLFTVCATAACFSAIVTELALARGQSGPLAAAYIALAAGTIFLSWGFVQIIFALHYAHVYYTAAGESGSPAKGGLTFPGDEPPDYWDFLHFSIIIGATAQTADILIVSKELRRIATLHSLIAFAFNTAVLALMVNISASLL